MTTFTLPDLGEGLNEAELVAWHVSPGDHVVADQPLLSVETDKAVVEIPCPWSGTVEAIHGEPGDILQIGDKLAEIATGKAKDTGAIVGDIKAAEPEAKTPARKTAKHEGSKPRAAKPEAAKPAATPAGKRPSAAPAVRQLAKKLGVDLATLAGTGPDGAILSTDVEAAASGAGAATGEPLRGVRRAMARAMAASGAVVVPATLTDHADIGDWGKKQTPMLRLIRALAAACKAEPALNARFDGQARAMQDQVDLSVAVDTADGLFVPVLKAVDQASEKDLADRLEAVKKGVADRSLPPEDLRGGTITLSNFGTLGGQHAALVVSPPQVAILGAGRIHDAVLAVKGKPRVRPVLPLSLTFDHRAVTGGEAARFLAAVRADLERAH